ncbi:MAG: hypothetical protein WCL19_10765 [Verrucomicrobiota bacterium]
MRHSLISLALLTANFAFAEPPPEASALLDVFPASQAPTFLTTPSEFAVSHKFQPGANRSQWAEGVDERAVFHAYLTHKSVGERSWELRLGKGGQLYSIVSSFGEAMPPQSALAPFVDEVWQMVAINSNLLDRMPELGKSRVREEANSYIHQSGMYVGKKQAFSPKSPFYAPLLATREDAASRSYAVMNWGQVPTASIHRSDVLFTTQFRDLGAGVIELSYLCFNFGNFPLNGLNTPWGGVRTSVFPELVLSQPDGSYRFHTPFTIDMPGTYGDIAKTGGWAAATQNAANPAAFALGLVFGRDLHWPGQLQLQRAKTPGFQHSPTVYGAGDSRHGARDYTVMDVSTRVNILPGETFFRRIYLVLGTLSEVAEAGRKLESFADYHPMDFTEATTPLLPLYEKPMDKGQIVPSLAAPSPDAAPLCHLYAHPVKHSKPLFLLQEAATGRYLLSTDPALLSRKEQFANPYPEGDPKHAAFQNRVQYVNHEGRAKSLSLLGYVMPRERADAMKHRYTALSAIPALATLFQAGESIEANALMLRTSATP